MAYWAAGAVHRDTRGGMIARKVGVQLARIVRDLQEKYTQLVVFYRTGKLAYVSLGAWESIDSKFAVTSKVNELKRLAMLRATEFNTAFKDTKVSDQFADLLKVIGKAPREARRIDKKYGVTSKIFAFGRGVVSSTIEGVRDLVRRGDGEDDSRGSESSRSSSSSSSYSSYSSYASSDSSTKRMSRRRGAGDFGGGLRGLITGISGIVGYSNNGNARERRFIDNGLSPYIQARNNRASSNNRRGGGESSVGFRHGGGQGKRGGEAEARAMRYSDLVYLPSGTKSPNPLTNIEVE